jgi:nitroreductase
METWDAIRARRDVRQFTDQPISDADLTQILEAGRRAPSGLNRQPWDLIVVTDREQLAALAALWRDAAHVAASAATVVLVAPVAESEPQARSIRFDLGQLTMSMMIAAAGLGIGSGHAGAGDSDQVRALLGFPDDRECTLMIAFGYPAHGPLSPLTKLARRPLEEIVHRGTW